MGNHNFFPIYHTSRVLETGMDGALSCLGIHWVVLTSTSHKLVKLLAWKGFFEGRRARYKLFQAIRRGNFQVAIDGEK